MKINWELTLLSLIALFLGIVVYTIWSIYNFPPVRAGMKQAIAEMAKAEAEAEQLGGGRWEEATRRTYEAEKHTRGTLGGGTYKDPVTLDPN